MSEERGHVPAGWYPVPEGLRWWDGREWTSAYAPVTQAPGVVVARRDPYETNHVLHLLLSFFTCGLWLPVWAVIGYRNEVARGRRAMAQQQALEQGRPGHAEGPPSW